MSARFTLGLLATMFVGVPIAVAIEVAHQIVRSQRRGYRWAGGGA